MNSSSSPRNAGGMKMPEQMDTLLDMAGKKLGKDPQQLRAQLESGQIGKALSGLDANKAAQVTSLLNDPKRLEELMNSPQVKAMLSGFMKN